MRASLLRVTAPDLLIDPCILNGNHQVIITWLDKYEYEMFFRDTMYKLGYLNLSAEKLIFKVNAYVLLALKYKILHNDLERLDNSIPSMSYSDVSAIDRALVDLYRGVSIFYVSQP